MLDQPILVVLELLLLEYDRVLDPGWQGILLFRLLREAPPRGNDLAGPGADVGAAGGGIAAALGRRAAIVARAA